MNFLYERGPEKSLRTDFLLLVGKWLQKLTQWGPLLALDPAPVASILGASEQEAPGELEVIENRTRSQAFEL